ncbi:MAG: DUF308 domain-containing protein [Bacteroidota bacterium]|nr:DUF308 domain-containing protein [Bacteroidota bacterium]MDP4250595.1 DUF308 domain-containing protein [Bacteroidota bacterium]
MPLKKKIPTAWLLMVIGFVFVAIGVFVFLFPWHAYYRLTKYTGILLLLNAILLLYIAISRTRNARERNWILAESIIDFLFVMIFFFNALLSFFALPFFIGLWMGFVGGLKVAASLALKKVLKGWGFILSEGIVSVLFSIWVFNGPSPKAIGITIPIGLFALLMGAFNIFEALRFKKTESTLDMML